MCLCYVHNINMLLVLWDAQCVTLKKQIVTTRNNHWQFLLLASAICANASMHTISSTCVCVCVRVLFFFCFVNTLHTSWVLVRVKKKRMSVSVAGNVSHTFVVTFHWLQSDNLYKYENIDPITRFAVCGHTHTHTIFPFCQPKAISRCSRLQTCNDIEWTGERVGSQQQPLINFEQFHSINLMQLCQNGMMPLRIHDASIWPNSAVHIASGAPTFSHKLFHSVIRNEWIRYCVPVHSDIECCIARALGLSTCCPGCKHLCPSSFAQVSWHLSTTQITSMRRG